MLIFLLCVYACIAYAPHTVGILSGVAGLAEGSGGSQRCNRRPMGPYKGKHEPKVQSDATSGCHINMLSGIEMVNRHIRLIVAYCSTLFKP